MRPATDPDQPWVALRAWHDPSARRLAWRATRDPYAVLVSEIMAQQTQAERAAAAWRRFTRRFPTVEDLAAASRAEVLTAWQGLGYNRRAVNLHRCAQTIVERHGGVVPEDLGALLDLPGIGPYTARAVLAFAFDHDVVPVDTNVARVLARLGDQVLSRQRAQRLADDLAARLGGPRLATALMDLGATVCTARRPACGSCPLSDRCRWANGDGPDPAAGGAHRPRPQGRFAGSTRQARGRVVDALRNGHLTGAAARELAGEHGQDLLEDLVADGLAQRTDGGFALPGWSGTA